MQPSVTFCCVLTLNVGLERQERRIAKFSNHRGWFFLTQVYKWQNGSFVLHEANLDNTRSASGLAVFEIDGTLKVAIAFFNDTSKSQSFQTRSPIYEWNTNSNSAVLLQEIDTNGPVGVEYFEHKGQHYLVFANSRASVDVYRWNGNRFISEQALPASGVQSAKPYLMQGNGERRTICIIQGCHFIVSFSGFCYLYCSF